MLIAAASMVFSDPEPQAIEWVKGLSQNCRGCKEIQAAPQESGLYVLMSFSVPDSVWIDLSREIDFLGGVFVLRGLPGDSFVEFQKRVSQLRLKGVRAPIQIHPRMFEDHGVNDVPAFLFSDDRGTDLLSGNVTLRYAALKRGENG